MKTYRKLAPCLILLFVIVVGIVVVFLMERKAAPATTGELLSRLILKRFEFQDKIVKAVEIYKDRAVESEKHWSIMKSAIEDSGSDFKEIVEKFAKDGRIDDEPKLAYAYSVWEMFLLTEDSRTKLKDWIDRHMPKLVEFDKHIRKIEIIREDSPIMSLGQEEQKEIDRLISESIVGWDSPTSQETKSNMVNYDRVQEAVVNRLKDY